MDPYYFSIIMAVYNTELFIREAIESVIAQDIGFNHVQLILVDDGSEDQGGSICDQYAAKYPDNILAIHQENQGLAAARNAGLPFARGRYVNFTDSDDKLSSDTLTAVWSFFQEHEKETDVVSIPMFFFEGKTGPHPLNNKFGQGSRVIDLQKEWQLVQLSISSCFVKGTLFPTFQFNTDLHYAEDVSLVIRILLQKKTLGVVSKGKYLYRRRQRGGQSLIQKNRIDPQAYLPKLHSLTEESISYCMEKNGSVPMFVQYTLMYDLQWIIAAGEIPKGVLSAKEKQEYLDRVYKITSSFDDEVILSQNFLPKEYMLFLLRKKYHSLGEIRKTTEDLQLYFKGHTVGSLADAEINIDFISLSEGTCTIEGYISFFPVDHLEILVFADFIGQRVYGEPVPEYRTKTAFGEELLRLSGFRLSFPLPEHGKQLHCHMRIEAEDLPCNPRCHYGFYTPISDELKNGYYLKTGWCLQLRNNNELILSKTSQVQSFLHEIQLYWELLFDRENHHRKSALIRMAYRVFRAVRGPHGKPIWMISDRRISAGDNGEAFFRYLRQAHPEIDARFVLRKDSENYAELASIGPVIENESLREKLTALLSEVIVSSQGELQYINPLYQHQPSFRDLMADKPFVFLQHGIIKDDLSDWLMRPKKNLFGFVTSAVPEYYSILNGHYGYQPERIWLTGLPRYDRLESAEHPNLITIMPTWRNQLVYDVQPDNMIHPLKPGFEQSTFFQFYHNLLSDCNLREAAKQYGYRLAFLPHPNFQPYIDLFQGCDHVQMFGIGTAYHTVYRETALVVTDYSSAVFDAVYLGRPVVYTQFDKDQFFSGEHIYREGYFNYERDGFGEVEYTLESTVNRIIEYMMNGCEMKEKYKERADRFFAFRDKKNCQRVYEKIMEGCR